jgi:1-acyl-sn-glycerol-3-phosphate acyltransferase
VKPAPYPVVAHRWEDVAVGRYATPANRRETRWAACPTVGFYALFFATIRRARAAIAVGREPREIWLTFIRETLTSLERVGVRFDLSGFGPGELPAGAFVGVGNHMSLMDALVAGAVITPQRWCSGVVAERTCQTPFVGRVLQTSGAVQVSAERPRADLEKMYREVVPRLRAGETIAVFPEGQRQAEFVPARFNSLGVKLARRADVPMVTFALKSDAWGIGWRAALLAPVRPERVVRLAASGPVEVTRPDQPHRAAQLRFLGESLRAWGGTVRREAREPWWLRAAWPA